MMLIDKKHTKLDKENNIVHLSYFVDNKEIAKIIFNYNKDRIDVVGDLYKILGYKDTIKYDEYLRLEQQFSKDTLERI